MKRFLAMVLTLAMVATLFAGLTLTASAAGYSGTGDFKKCTGALSSGYYVFGTGSATSVNAVNNTVGSSWAVYTATSVSSGTIKNPSTNIVWYYDSSTGKLQSAGSSNYIYWPSTGNTGGVGATGRALTITETGTSGIYNVKVADTPARLFRQNGTSGYRFYTSSTGVADIYFYKLESKTLSSIAVSNNHRTFTVGGTFVKETVTATYSDSSTADVTNSATFSGYNMSSAGTQTVNVSYTEGSTTKSTSYTINVVAPTPYTLTYSVNGDTSVISGGSVNSGSSVSLPTNVTAPANYIFVGWLPTTYATNDTAPSGLITGTSYTMPAANTTLYAVFAISSGSGSSDKYELVTSASSLAAGDKILIVGVESGTYYALKPYISGNNCGRNAVSAPVSNVITTTVADLTLGGSAGAWTLFDGTYYLYAAGGTGSSNYLKGAANANNANAKWTISFSGNNATIKTADTTVARHTIMHNTGSDIFSCYASGQSAVSIYKQQAGTTYSGYTTTVNTAATYYTLTYSVSPASSGSIDCEIANNGQVEEDTDVTLTATPADHFTFANWTVTGTEDYVDDGNELLVTMTDDVTVTANFTAEPTYTVTLTQTTGGTMTASKLTGIYAGETITLTATPNTHYSFNGWQITPSVTVTSNTFTMPAANVTITGSFTEDAKYTVTYYDADGHTKSTEQVYAGASPASVPSVTAPDGFSFIGWYSTTYDNEEAPTLVDPATATISGNTEFHAVYGEGSGSGGANEFEWTTDISNGDYIIGYYSSGSVKAFDSDNIDTWLYGQEVSPSSNKITTTDTSIIWTLTGNANGFTLKNKKTGNYLTSSGTGSGSISLSSTGTTYNASASGSNYVIRTGDNDIRFNSTGYRMYASSNTQTGQKAMSFYKATASYENYTTNPVSTKISVTWMNGTETFDSGKVAFGDPIVPPATNPTKTEAEQEYYTFAGWSETEGGTVITSFPTASAQLGDKTYYAVYTTTQKLTVTWKNYDNTTLDIDYCKSGDTPAYTGATPTKPADSSFYYTFSGWTPTVSAITSSITYTATFEQHDRFEMSASLSKPSVKVGSTATLNYTITDMGEETDDYTPTVTIADTSVATYNSSTGKITGVSVGSTTVTVTVPGCLDANGDPLTQTINLTVTEGSVGGYTLMTKDNAPDDWTGDYIIMGRLSAYLDYLNSYQILTPKWEDGSAIVEDGNGSTVAQNNASLVTLTEDGDTAEGTIASAYVEGDTISMEATGDNDFGTHTIYDRITEIDDSYAFTFERIGDSDIYTIRVKGTNYYLANTNTTVSGNNGMQYVTTSDVNDTTMLWKIRWATADDGLTATNGYTPDVLLIESVYGLENSVSRCILFNNMGKPETASNITGARFSVYGQNAYHNNTTSLAGGSNGSSYNIYLFGNPNPFKPQIYHLGDQITIANAGEISNTNATTLVTSALFPDINDYPNWSQVGDPAWSIVENSTGNAMTIASDGTITLNGSTAGSYALVQVTYTVHDVINNVNHDVSTIAKIVVTAPTYTYSTVIYETLSNNDTEVQYTVNNRVSELPLAAYVVNDDTGVNSKTGNVAMGGTLSWSASVASGDGTATIGADGILHLSGFTTDGIVNVTVSGATGDGTSATSATYKVYVKAINYTTTIVNDGNTGTYNSGTDTITYSGSENEGQLAYNVVNADGYDQDDGVFNLYGGSWAISGNAYGATINNTTGYLNFSGVNRSEEHTITVLVSHLTATEGDTTTPNLSDTITVVIGALVEEDTLDAVDDLVIVDYALPVTFNVLNNDNINVEVVVTADSLPSGVVNNGNGSFTFTPSGWQTTDQTFEYTVAGTVNGELANDTATVTLKTADSVYYEDTYSGIFNFTGTWTNLTDGTAIAAQTSSLDTADIFEHDANYESYAMYSGGTAKKTTVSKSDASRPSVSFTFAGTGFDVISATTNNGGAVLMQIKDADNHNVTDPVTGRNLNAIYDNFRGYVYCDEAYTRYTLVPVKRCDENGTANPLGEYYWDNDNMDVAQPFDGNWYTQPNGDTAVCYTTAEAENTFAGYADPEGNYIIKEHQSHWKPYDKAGVAADTYNTNFYQIPIIKVTGLSYDTYTVTLTPTYSSAYDRAGDGSYDFIFDGVRIHNPVANRAAEYKYISIHDAVKAGEGFGSGEVVACDHVGYEWSDWTFYSRARNTNSATTTNRGSFVQYCSFCGGVANTAYFHVAVTADNTELGVGGYGSRPAEAVLSYTLDADESSQAGVEAAIQAKLDAINGRLSQHWESNRAAVMNCTNFGNIAVASGEGTTYATLQLKDPSGTIYASAIHSPMITVYADEDHVHTFGDWTHDPDSDPGTHTRTCTDAECSFYEKENCVFTEVVTTQPTQTTPGSKTCTCALCSYSYVAEIPALGGHTATFHVPAGATAPAAQTGNSATMPAAVAAPAAFDAHNYTFVGWIGNTVTDTTTQQTFHAAGTSVTLDANTDFYALYTYGGNAGGYTLSSTAPQAGDSVIIAAEKDGTYYAMPQDSFTGEALTVSGNTATNVDGLTWTAYNASYSNSTGIGFNNGTKPLHMNSTALKVASGDQNGTFEFTASGDGFIVYSNQNDRWMKYNGSSFGVANAANGATPIVFFISSGATYYTTIPAATCKHPNTTPTTTAATCTEAGFTTVTCNDCHEVISVTPIAALGHNYTSTVSGSVTTYTCSRCSDTYTEDSNFAASYILQDGLSVVGGSRSGNTITLPTGISGMDDYDAHTYEFVGWATATSANSTTNPTVYAKDEEVTITADTTFYPVYSYTTTSGSGGYEKVTSTSGLTDGQYLIVYETGSVALDSSLATIDAVEDTIDVTISNNTIPSNTTTDNSAFTFTASNGSFLGTNGKYIGHTGTSNTLNTSTTAMSNTVTIDSDGNAVIDAGSSYVLRFNALSDQMRFRYYKGTQQAIQLYKKGAGGSSTTTYTFEMEKNAVVDTYAGTVTASPSRIELSTGTAAVSSTLKKNGTAMAANAYTVTYALTGSAASLSGTTVSAGANSGNVTVTATFTVGGSTVYTATCNVTVYDPNAEVTVNYIGSQTGKVYNWGTRGTTATFLTEMADNYYTGSYSYDTLSALTGSSTATAAAIYQSSLGTAIHNMLVAKQTSTTTYAGTTSLYAYTDCVESGNRISSYYSAALIGPTWDSGHTWNREHTWPNSKGLDDADENDIMMLRPTSVSENSSRSNNAYGENSGYYDPNKLGQNLHGDVARLMLQHLMRWGNTSKFYGSGGVMESRAVLLEWLEEDPVDTWELGRNDAVQRITGVRNVFVDYPELAFILLGEAVPANYSTPSKSGIVSESTYSATRPSNYEAVTEGAAPRSIAPAALTEKPATRSIATGSFNGAVIIDGKGTANTFDDFEAYGPNNEVYLAPGQGIVFSLSSDIAITSQDLQIGAKAVNGTAAAIDVASISNGTESTGIKYLLQNKAIASATEMYYELDTTQMGWNGTESSVLVIYNSGSGVLSLTNLRYSTVNNNTLTMNINEVQTQKAAKMIQIVYGEPITDPDPIEPTDLDLNFKSAELVLNSDIAINFNVEEAVMDSAYGVYAVFTKALYNDAGDITGYAEETVSEATFDEKTGMYSFRFTGINPAEMGSAVTAQLFGTRDGELISGKTVNYSVLTYINNMYDKVNDKDFRALIADLAAYGAAAQNYISYNTANLVTASAAEGLMAYATAEAPELSNATAISGEGAVEFTGAFLSLREKVTVCYMIDASEYAGNIADLELRIYDGKNLLGKISGADFAAADGKYIASFSGLNALQMRTVVTAEVYDGDTCVSNTLDYSIESYAVGKAAGNDALAALVNAMMNFGISAENYFAK